MKSLDISSVNGCAMCLGNNQGSYLKRFKLERSRTEVSLIRWVIIPIILIISYREPKNVILGLSLWHRGVYQDYPFISQ